MKKILVIGSFMTDLVVKSDRFTQEGETIIGTSFNQFPGGKGANQAVAAAKLGGNVEIVGELGKDAFGEEQIASMEQNNIKHDHVLFTDKVRSGIGNPQLDQYGHNRIVVIPGANMEIKPSDLDELEDTIQSSDIIVLQLEIPMETVYHAIELGHRHKKTIILNPAPAKKLDSRYASMIDIIAPNEHEATLLTGIDTDTEKGIINATDALLAQGYGSVIMTLGEKGCYFKSSTASYHVPAFKVTPIDTTAAGDSFIGAFAYGLANESSIEDSLKYATACSGLAVTKMGAQPSLPSKIEVDEFLKASAVI